MHRSSCSLWAVAILGFCSPLVTSLPAPQQSATPSIPGTPSGLRGDESLLGDTGGAVDTADSALVSDYDEAPGQTSSADLGFYFDFTKLQNPQPIRGTKGGTDPGPRKSPRDRRVIVQFYG